MPIWFLLIIKNLVSCKDIKIMDIVNIDWLEKNLSNDDVFILDCSWHLPNTNRSGEKEFLSERIPGAIFFNIDEISDPKSPYPHMIPNEEEFSLKVSNLGISNDHHIITYDTLGIFSSARVYWIFKQYGHKKISILNGGLKYWKIKNKKLDTSSPTKKERASYHAKLNRSKIKKFEDIKKNLEHKKFKLIDARPSGRFNGMDPEPRAEIQSGSIKNSFNIPFTEVIDQETGCFKEKEELKKVFLKNQIKQEDDVIFSCGSGVAACVVGSAYKSLGTEDNFNVFDGSWTEWALRSNLKIK